MAGAKNRTVRRRTPRRPVERRRALVVVYSPDAAAVGRSLPLDGSSYLIGRDAEVSIDDAAMSRKHVVVAPDSDGAYSVQDRGAENGTFVDGARVDGAAPFEPHQVLSIGETLLVFDLEPSSERLPTSPDGDPDLAEEFVGLSLGASRVRASLSTVAPDEGTVLLLGATGAGKEVSAQAIHRLSGREGPFVPVNCAAIPAELAEAELFGHGAGAFTGAAQARDGYFVQSSGGTLFLDEIGDLPLDVQAKLLRVLEQREVAPLGGGPRRQLDLRVVAATHKPLMEGDAFRQDLYARLGDWVLRLPPLAERKVDVIGLWTHFLKDGVARTPPEVAEALLLHDWPMNVRELAKLAARCDRLHPRGEITLDALPEAMRRPLLERFDDMDAEDAARDLGEGAPSREALIEALTEARGNIKEVAAAKGWHRTQVYRWLQRGRIDPKSFR